MRRRAATALVVAAVAAVAVAAIVDTVRPKQAPALDPAAADQLRELGITGRLIYTDANCELHALWLPGLESAPLPEGPDVGCRISVSPSSQKVAAGGARWSPHGSEYAICRGARVDVVPASGGSTLGSYDGCAPAWRQDSMLTFVRGGAIRQARFERVLVPRRELERAARTHPNAPTDARIEELRVLDLAWTSQDEVVALIRSSFVLGLPEAVQTVAGFRAGRLAWQRHYFGTFERLVISTGGDVVPVPVERQQFTLRFRITPSGPADWSPDGRRLAAATRVSVYILDPAAGRSVRIPVAVRDLAWR
jgi:hypothetical protein